MACSGAEGGYTGYAGEGISPPAFTVGYFRAGHHPGL